MISWQLSTWLTPSSKPRRGRRVLSVAPDSALVATCLWSPNADARSGNIDAIILHYTGMPSGEGALEWLCAPESRVSAHYLIDEAGGIIQMVPEERRAWHAGVSAWGGRTHLNDASIGIEIVNPGHEHGYCDFPAQQVEAVIALVLDICARRRISPQRVLAHSDVAPDRKEDPGERFPWQELAARGGCIACPPAAPNPELGTVQVDDETLDSKDLLADLRDFGYGLDSERRFTDLARLCVVAFQRRFLPNRVDGVADGQMRQTLKCALRVARSTT